jgi:hypothetical protein
MKKQLVGIFFGLATSLLSSSSSAQDIRFPKGQNSIMLRGTYGFHNNTYTFRARKGQQASISLLSAKGKAGSLVLNLYRYCGEEYGIPIADKVKTWSGKLPCTDQYSFDVITNLDLQNITEEKPLNEKYTLKIRIR